MENCNLWLILLLNLSRHVAGPGGRGGEDAEGRLDGARGLPAGGRDHEEVSQGCHIIHYSLKTF